MAWRKPDRKRSSQRRQRWWSRFFRRPRQAWICHYLLLSHTKLFTYETFCFPSLVSFLFRNCLHPKQQPVHYHSQRGRRRRHDPQHKQPFSIEQHHRPAAGRRAQQRAVLNSRRLLDHAFPYHFRANKNRKQFHGLDSNRAGQELHGAIR